MTARTTPDLILFTDAKVSRNKFALTDAQGEVIWYGSFFEEWVDEQSVGEMEAAKKAIWLAGKWKQTNQLPSLKLELRVDAEWLTWANAATSGEANSKGKPAGGKARKLAYAAEKAGVELHVVWVRGTSNPADKWTTEGGYQKYSDYTGDAFAATREAIAAEGGE